MRVSTTVAVSYTKAFERAASASPADVEGWLERALDRIASADATLDRDERLRLWASVRAYEHALVMHRDGSGAVPVEFEIDENH